MNRPALPAGARQTWLTGGYDRLMFSRLIEDFYENSDFCNWGYWLEGTSSQLEACENLMEKLLAFLPEKKGSVLDVACGKGGTTAYLLRYFEPENVTGINISRAQVDHCRAKLPKCDFAVMDATRLRFRRDTFDCVICVEAAFHFETRDAFFREARRVLRPGGTLILSDILFTRFAHQVGPGLGRSNWIASPHAYGMLLRKRGFESVRVIDATEQSWWRYERYQSQYVQRRVATGEIDARTAAAIDIRRSARLLGTRYYVLAAASKPRTEVRR